ncbi:MAG: tail fiber domain-containing protein [Balneola sp.]
MKSILQKIVFSFIVVLVTAVSAYAQVPQGFNFQAVARGATGGILAEQALGVQVSIIKGTEDGNPVYEEAHTVTTNPLGLIQIVIGEGTASEGNDFSAIDFGNDNYFVKLAIDPAGGTEYEDLGTTRLLSVPYALVAQKAVEGGNGSGGSEDVITINTDDPNLQDSLKIIRLGSETADEIAYGVQIEGASTGKNRPLSVSINEQEANTASQYAISGTASGSGSGTHIGMLATAWNPAATGGSRYGAYGQANSLAKYNYGMNGVAAGSGNGDEGEGFGLGSINFGLYGYATGNNWNNTGLEARNDGEFGKVNYGVHGLSSAGSTDSTKNYAVAGRASGPGINYGVYGAAWDGIENYAGYFDGEVQINGNLTVNGSINGGMSNDGANGQTLDSLFLSTQPEAEFQSNTTFYPGYMRLEDETERMSIIRPNNLYFYNTGRKNVGWFGTNGNSGFAQLVGYNSSDNFTGAILTGFASWNNDLPYFFMEGSSEDPYVQLINFGINTHDNGDEKPYFDLQTTNRGIAGKPSVLGMHVNKDGNNKEGASMTVYGGDTPNIQLGGKDWENNELPFFNMFGSTQDGGEWFHNNLEMNVSGDGTNEWGSISLKKTNISGQTSQETILLDGGSGNIEISGTLNQSSDERLKKDIRTLDNVLEKTMEMRGVSYTWKTDVSNEDPQIGVIAQEVEKIYPEFVRTDENGMKSVNYAQMTAVLIEAVKALNLELQELKNDNATLQAKVDKQQELEIRLSRIEKLLSSGNGNTTYSLTED